MDEAWERAVEAALEGQAESSSTPAPPRSLTLDGAVKCLHGKLPPPGILERYQTLEHLSIASVGVSSLEKFPRLCNLQRLILSDNRIAGGLEFLVEAGLDSLRDLDLSNNRIQFLEDLAPLAQLRLVSLDLYECPVTRIKDYRSRVFGMIRTLKYLDKMDADENERPDTDDEEDEEEDEEEEDEEDPGSGEVDGDDHRAGRSANGDGVRGTGAGIVDVDEDEESDADEEETESGARAVTNGRVPHHLSNGCRVAPAGAASFDVEEDEEEEEDVEDDEDDEEEELGEEVDDEEGEDVVEVHDVGDTDEDIDGVEEEGEDQADEEDDEDEDVDGEEDEEDVEDEEEDGKPGSTGKLTSTDGEIDGHEQGEGDEDENGEIGEEDEQVEDREFEEVDGEDEDEVK